MRLHAATGVVLAVVGLELAHPEGGARYAAIPTAGGSALFAAVSRHVG